MPYVKASMLVALRRKRMLSTVFALDGNEPQPYLDRSEVELLSSALRASVPLNYAATALGIAYHGVEQLETQGLVTFERRLGTTASDGSYRVTSSSLEILTNMLIASAEAPATGWIKLTTVMRMVGGRSKPWGPVIEQMLNGGVKYAVVPGSQPLLRRVLVDPVDAKRLAELVYVPPCGARFIDMMSKNDALGVLNLHPRHARTALERWPSAKSRDRTVPVAEVLELSRQLVSLGELVARSGHPVKTVLAMLEENGVSSDACWSRRDKAEAALFGSRLGST